MRFLFVVLVFATATYHYGSAVDINDIPDLLNGNFEAFDEVLAQGEEDFLPWRPRILTLGMCKKLRYARCTKYSHLYKLLQCLWEKWYCEGVISNGVCHDKKRSYIDGQMIKRDCNKCQCVVTKDSKIGSFQCTEKQCNVPTTAKPMMTTLAPGFCFHNGRKYTRGTTIKKGCNTCSCYAVSGHQGAFVCTTKACPVTTVKPATTHPVVAKVGYCVDGGKKSKDGASIKQNCNTCVCHAAAGTVGRFACTKMLCSVTTAKPVKTHPVIKKQGFCLDGGKKYKHGQTIKQDCNACKCIAPSSDHKGVFACTKILCTGFCFYNGKSYKNGATLKKDCNTCQCRAMATHVGTFFCTNKLCSVIAPTHPTNEIRHTAAVKNTMKPKITKAGKIAPTHSAVKTNGMKRTTLAPVRPAGLGRCFYKKKTYKRGEIVRMDCKKCVCVVVPGEKFGVFTCSIKQCPVNTVRPTRAQTLRTQAERTTMRKVRTFAPFHSMKPKTRQPTKPKVVTRIATMKPKVIATKKPKVYTPIPTKKIKVTIKPKQPTKPKIVTRIATKKPVTKKPVVVTAVPTKKMIVTKRPKVVTLATTKVKVVTRRSTIKPTTAPRKHECYYVLRRNCYTTRIENIFKCFWRKWFCRSGRLPTHYKH